MAGIIGARGNNSAGIAGVNWNVKLLPLKAIGPGGGTDSVLLEAYNYAKALRQRGVNLRVLNNSYGGQAFSQSLSDAIKALGNADILFVAAAGNETLNACVASLSSNWSYGTVVTNNTLDTHQLSALRWSTRKDLLMKSGLLILCLLFSTCG